MKVQQHKVFGVHVIEKGKGRILLTESLVPEGNGSSQAIIEDGKEYRIWDAGRSKLAAMILKGSPNVFLRKADVVLYLGCASGTTASHVSDIVGKEGFIFAVDISPRVMRDMVFLCYRRKNMAPILADANRTEELMRRISAVDVVYQDLAQKSQIEIFLKNCDLFLKNGGYAILAVKARSIDVTRQPKRIFGEIKHTLEEVFTIIDYRELEPYQKDHCMFIVKKK